MPSFSQVSIGLGCVTYDKPLVKQNKYDPVFAKIVIPFIKSKLEELGLPASQPALATFDVFKGQQTDHFKELLQSNHIRFVVVPATI